MINPVWTVLCQRHLIDEQTKSHSYIDSVNELFTYSLPRELPPLTVASLWETIAEREGEEWFIARYRLLDPQGKLIDDLETEKIQYSNKFIHVAIDLSGSKVEQEGRHKVLVEYKEKGKRTWKKANEIPFCVILQKKN